MATYIRVPGAPSIGSVGVQMPGVAPPPTGFVYLLGADGAYLQGADGAYLLGVAS